VADEQIDDKSVGKPGLFLIRKAPRAPLGKVVSYTASGQVVIQSEFSDQLEALTKAYIEEYKPKGITELTLVRDLATAQCRCEYTRNLLEKLGVQANEKMTKTLTRYEASNRSLFKRTLRLLKEMHKTRAEEAARRPQLVKPKITGGC
jgi:hypothetical protein